MSPPIPLIIVTGYLGAGKTTFVRRLIPQLDQLGLRGLLLVNEIGKINVDGPLLSQNKLEQLELLGGCVCCSLRGDLYDALNEGVNEYQPDYILIETSGLSDPAEMIDATTLAPLPEKLFVSDVVTLVDAAGLGQQLKLSMLAKLQIRFASALILNKCDTIPPKEQAQLTQALQEMNPQATLLATQEAEIDFEKCFSSLFSFFKKPKDQRSWPQNNFNDQTISHDHDHQHHQHAGHYAFNIKLPDELEEDQLLDVLRSLPPRAYRVKGFARIKGQEHPWVFQRVGELSPQASPFVLEGIDVPIEMVVIGPGLSEQLLDPALAKIDAQVLHKTQ